MFRFGVRTAILVTFAAFGTSGFGTSLAALLWMAIILCAVIGTLRREPVFAAGLNHWDEMVAYTALYCSVTALAVAAAGAILAASIGLEAAFYVRRLID